MDQKVSHWITRLSKFYWSPNRPETYVIAGDGLGRSAWLNYAAFSISWATCNRLRTATDHQAALPLFKYLNISLQAPQAGVPVQDLICLHTAEEVLAKVDSWTDLPPALQALIRKASKNAVLPEFPGVQPSHRL